MGERRGRERERWGDIESREIGEKGKTIAQVNYLRCWLQIKQKQICALLTKTKSNIRLTDINCLIQAYIRKTFTTH